MGYRPQRKTLKLLFEDDEYEGLIVKARSLDVGTFMRMNALGAKAAAVVRQGADAVSAEDMGVLDDLFEVFAASLVEWNLEDEQGAPVPATLDGVRTQDLDFIFPVIKAWFAAMAQVSGPLGPRSSNGARSVEPSLPMEAR